MNDRERAEIFRTPVADTPETWKNLREAVKGVRDDLRATNTNRLNQPGKWAVRYPNGDRPANEPDALFMANARGMVLKMMDKIETLNVEVNDLKDAADTTADAMADMTEGYDKETERMAAEVTALGNLTEAQTAEIKALKAENDSLKSKLENVTPATPEAPAMQGFLDKADMPQEPVQVSANLTEAPKETLKPKRTRKPKTE